MTSIIDYSDIKFFVKAKDYAREAHEGQIRLVTGENYFTHPLRVSQRVKTDFQKIVALLHDTIEDTKVTHEDLERKFGKEIADCVETLSHRKDESHYDYITRVLTNEDAVAVKISDICDNLQDHPSQNAIKKCLRALPRLMKYEEDQA